MQDLIEKLKNLKNISKEQYKNIVCEYSYNQVVEDLKKAGIKKDELSDEEFQELLNEQITKSESFSKGALMATGAFLFLELLG